MQGEFEFYAAQSGLGAGVSLADHKLAYFRAQSGLANASLQDAELAFLRSELPGVAGTLNDLRLAYFAGMSPLASGTLSDHMAAVFAAGGPSLVVNLLALASAVDSWAVSAGTGAVVTTTRIDGVGPDARRVIEGLWTDAPESGSPQINVANSPIGVLTQGETYTFSVWVWSEAAISMVCKVDWCNDGNGFVSLSQGDVVAVPAGTWTRLSGTAVMPGGTVSRAGIRASIVPTASAIVGTRIRACMAMIEEGSELHDFVEGDLAAPTAGTLASSSITATAFDLTVSGAADETALHAQPYRFSTDNGSTWSPWQASNVFNVTGKTASTGYTCVHQTRDTGGNVSTGSSIVVNTSSASWTPASLGAALRMWYDADDAATFSFSSGAVVSQWRDKSGNARHLAQGTVASQPVRNGTIGSKTAVAFDGSDDVLIWNGTTVSTSPLTIAVVVKPIAAKTNANIFDVSASAGRVLFEIVPGTRWRMFAGSIFNYTTVPPTSNTNYSVVSEYNGSSSKLRVNRAATATGDAGNNALMDGNPLDFLVGRGQSVGTEMQMQLGELIVVNGVLSAPDLASLESYLSTKWGTP